MLKVRPTSCIKINQNSHPIRNNRAIDESILAAGPNVCQEFDA